MRRQGRLPFLGSVAPGRPATPKPPLPARPRRCSYAQHYGTADDDVENTAVGQQALMPTATDPKLWVVQCGEGQEREAVVCLLQKCYDYAKKGTPLLIKAVFCQDHLKVRPAGRGAGRS